MLDHLLNIGNISSYTGLTKSEHPASTVDEVHVVAAVVHPSGTETTPVLLQAEPTWDP